MRISCVQKLINKLRKKNKNVNFNQNEYDSVLDFFVNYQSFRTLYDCSKITGIEINKCEYLKKLLYQDRKLGMYYFGEKLEPQPFMLEYIKKRIPSFSINSKIAEIGPGRYPIVSGSEYINWFGFDPNYKNGYIDFCGRIWEPKEYPNKNVFNASWENCNEITTIANNSFDFIISSHSFEHVFEPIKSLNNAANLLKPNGYIVLFVPDGFSDEPAARNEMTHTLYLVPDMIKEFFSYSGHYKNLSIETFRPNYDYVIVAQKK